MDWGWVKDDAHKETGRGGERDEMGSQKAVDDGGLSQIRDKTEKVAGR